MPISFAITARPRTGSNHLVSLLDSHADICCYGEVFRPRYKVSARIGKSLADFDDPESRAKNPAQVIDTMLALNSDAAAVGFKIFPNHLKLAPDALQSGVDLIIRIIRENTLAVYSSALTAKLSGQGALRVGKSANRVKVRFEACEFDKFLKARQRERRILTNAVRTFDPKTIFDLDYADLNESGRLDALQSFIGVRTMELTSNMQKRNPSDILARFDNPEDAAAFVVSLGHEEWAHE